MPNIPRNIKKPQQPLGGIGAERQSKRAHSLVIDDRLLSKQYITGRVDSKVSDVAYGDGTPWADVDDIAPSKGAVQAYLASLTVNPSHWTQDGSGGSAKTRTVDTGNVGIGSTLAYSDINQKLVVDGALKVIGPSTETATLRGSGLAITDDGCTLDMGSGNVSLLHIPAAGGGGHPAPPDNLPGLLMYQDRRLYFNDVTEFIHAKGATGGAGAGILGLGADTEIDLTAPEVEINATTIDMNGAADISGNLAVGGNTTIAGNLTVTGTATATHSETVNLQDNMIILNSNATGSASEDAGIEIERGDDTNRKLFWDESEDAWVIETAAGVYTEIAGGGGTLTGTNTGDVTIVLASGVPTGSVTISNQAVTLGDKFVYNEGTANTIGVDGGADGKLSCFGTEGGSGTGTTGLVVKGGNSASGAPAVAITGALEADTKSFNIPHPLDSNKRLVYGCLEGPEYGMYQRGSFLVNDERRIVAIDLPNYWFKMVYEDYAINITTYGDYNVWINNRDENGFWVETNAEGEWNFDWSVIGGRKDAKLEVEPDA